MATTDGNTKPRPPQGIVLRHRKSGNFRLDYHPKHKCPMIDPECLVVNGEPPYLALPIAGTTQVRVRQVAPEIAAYMLTCDPGTGGPPSQRLATDEEIAAYKAELEARRASVEASAEKDQRRREKV